MILKHTSLLLVYMNEKNALKKSYYNLSTQPLINQPYYASLLYTLSLLYELHVPILSPYWPR